MATVCPRVVEANPDTCTFPDVNVGTEYGWDLKVKMMAPVFTGALGFDRDRPQELEHFAVGAALSGVTCGVRRERVRYRPGPRARLERQITSLLIWTGGSRTYKRYHRGYGELARADDVEDTRLGVAEYVINTPPPARASDTIEAQVGPGVPSVIGGDVSKVDSLSGRSSCRSGATSSRPIRPIPSSRRRSRMDALKQFERHSRLGFIDEEGFLAEVRAPARARLQAHHPEDGAYGLRELAMALKWGSDAKIDLLTIDGAPGGTGMSPWR